jgi:hypothetical protein
MPTHGWFQFPILQQPMGLPSSKELLLCYLQVMSLGWLTNKVSTATSSA